MTTVYVYVMNTMAIGKLATVLQNFIQKDFSGRMPERFL